MILDVTKCCLCTNVISIHLKSFGLSVTNVAASLYWLFSLSPSPCDFMGCRRRRVHSESEVIFWVSF